MQLSIEYLSHMQSLLEDTLMDYEAEYHGIEKSTTSTLRKCDTNKKAISSNKESIHKKKFVLKDYELMFKDLGFLNYDMSSVRFPCEICNVKILSKSNKNIEFKSLYDLEKHYEQ